MNSTLKSRLKISLGATLIVIFFLLTVSMQAQSLVKPGRCPHNFPLLPTGKTEFHYASKRFQKEVALKTTCDLDSIRYYGHIARCLAQSAGYHQGLVNIYLGLGSAYVDKNVIDSSKIYGQLALQHSLQLRDTVLMIRSHLGYGWTLIYDDSDYKGAIDNFKKGADLAKLIDDKDLLTNAYTKLVKIYYLMYDYWNAYDICNALIKLDESNGDIDARVSNYYMLSYIFSAINLHDKQMDMVNTLLIMSQYVNDSTSLYLIYNAAFNGYIKKKDYDTALKYARKLLPLARAAKKDPICYAPIAQVYFETEQLDSARYYYETMLDKQLTNGSYIDIYEYLNLGKIEFRSGNRQKALEYLNLAEANISKPPLFTQKEIYKALYEYHEAEGDLSRSHDYLEKYTLMADSVFEYNNSMVVGISIFEKEVKAFENQVALLTKDKEIQTVMAAKEAQKAKMVYGSTLLGFLLSGFGFVRYKKQKTLKAKQALLNERLRISRELHDEVGSTLSGIAMYSHLAKTQLDSLQQDKAQNSLSIMQRSASEMVTKLSDIVWLINPSEDTIAELLDRLEEYAREMASARNMDVQIDLQESLSKYHIPMEARRNIYLFCKESINNAVKYSNGTMIRLQVMATADKFRFSVSDDGIGFDEITVRRGNGLKNMRRRAEEIGATFHIESTPNKGSQIALQYKLTQ